MIVDLGIRRFKDSLKYQNNDEIKEYKEKQWNTIDLKDTVSNINRKMNRRYDKSIGKFKRSKPKSIAKVVTKSNRNTIKRLNQRKNAR